MTNDMKIGKLVLRAALALGLIAINIELSAGNAGEIQSSVREIVAADRIKLPAWMPSMTSMRSAPPPVLKDISHSISVITADTAHDMPTPGRPIPTCLRCFRKQSGRTISPNMASH